MTKTLIEDLIVSSLQHSPELHVHMLAAECVRRGRGGMKPHTFAEMVNRVRDLAFDFGTTEQFRDRVASLLGEFVQVSDEPGGAVVVPEIPTWEECEEKVRRGEKQTALEKFVLNHDWSKTDTQFRDGLESVFDELRKSSIPADRVLKDGEVSVHIFLHEMLKYLWRACEIAVKEVVEQGECDMSTIRNYVEMLAQHKRMETAVTASSKNV